MDINDGINYILIDKVHALWGFRECMVRVEDLPEELQDSLTPEEIEQCTVKRLEDMGISVVPEESQLEAFRTPLEAPDERIRKDVMRRYSTVEVRVDAINTSRETICAYVELKCNRAVFIDDGHVSIAPVWNTGKLLCIGADEDPKSKIIYALNELLDQLGLVWKPCNP
jgi:hypothetical protein